MPTVFSISQRLALFVLAMLTSGATLLASGPILSGVVMNNSRRSTSPFLRASTARARITTFGMSIRNLWRSVGALDEAELAVVAEVNELFDLPFGQLVGVVVYR